MPQQPLKIGDDVTALMSGAGDALTVGDDVTHLMTERPPDTGTAGALSGLSKAETIGAAPTRRQIAERMRTDPGPGGTLVRGAEQGLMLELPGTPNALAEGLVKILGAVRNRVGQALSPAPAFQKAVEFGMREGIPVDVATATGNRAVSGAQNLADRSMGGSFVAQGAEKAKNAALADTAARLAGRAHSAPVTPEQAGTGVRQAVTGRIQRLHGAANRAYNDVRAIEQQMPMTADTRAAKQALVPIVQQMERQMPVAQQQASPGLKALRNVVEGEDFPQLSQLDADLSAIKGISRGAESPYLRNVSQGMAAKAVGELEKSVQDVVQGTPAEAALRIGRGATKGKYATAEVLDQLRTEPVQLFNQATMAKDAGIDQLRAVAKIAPRELPKVGRAFLEDVFSTATAKGGFDKAQTINSKWNNLGPETKKLLFPNQGLRTDLDSFFLLAEKMAENPNPSGTGYIVGLTGQGTLLFTHPVIGISTVLGGAAASAVMHSPQVVRLLTQGLQTPRSATSAAALAGQLDKALRSVVMSRSQDPPPGLIPVRSNPQP